jgi:hypothetical protein
MVHVSPSVAQRVLQDYERQRDAQMDLPTSACPEAAANRGEDSLAVVVRQARDNDTSQQLYVWWKKDVAGINGIGEKMTISEDDPRLQLQHEGLSEGESNNAR